MSTKFVAAMLLLPLAALANGYDSPDEAAIAALSEALPLSVQFEYAGVIYEQDGRFHFTEPKSSGEVHDIEVHVQYPSGAKLVGLYHTHPDTKTLTQSGADFGWFSPYDIAVAEQLGLPSYMAYCATGDVRKFVPGETSIERLGFKYKSDWSRGELIGSAFDLQKNSAGQLTHAAAERK